MFSVGIYRLKYIVPQVYEKIHTILKERCNLHMELNEFKKSLHDALVARGIDNDKAEAGVAGVTKNLTEARRQAIDKIKSDADLGRFADSVADRIRRQADTTAREKTPVIIPADTAEVTANVPTKAPAKKTTGEKPKSSAAADGAAQTAAPAKEAKAASGDKPAAPAKEAKTAPGDKATAPIRAAKDNRTTEFSPVVRAPKKAAPVSSATQRPAPKAAPKPAPAPAAHDDEEEAIATKKKAPKKTVENVKYANPAGDRTFKLVLLCGIPIWALAAAILILFFGGLYATVIALILICLIGMIAVVIGGVAVTLVGLIYGGIKLFSVMPEGLYEIGLAAVILGGTMLIGIVLYNLALRFLPQLFSPLKSFVLWTVDRIIDLYYIIKKECYKR